MAPIGSKKSISKKRGAKQKTRQYNLESLTQAVIKVFASNPTHTWNYKQVSKQLDISTQPLRQTINRILEVLAIDDTLICVKPGSYKYNLTGALIEGIFERHANGHNAIIPEEGGKSIFIAERNSMHALNGDRVRARLFAKRQGGASEAEVIAIVERSKHTFIGRLEFKKNWAIFITEDRTLSTDILIPLDALNGAKPESKVEVAITDWPNTDKIPIGRVIKVLGRRGDNDTEMRAILAEHDIDFSYPQEAVEEAERLSGEITKEELSQREDFREIPTLTIDPADAKDFDDALSWRKLEGGLVEVGVHIADVSYYVTPGSVIDKEAYDRATSIYLVDRTIPMLPERLCNDLCSLRPNEVRLAFSCVFVLNEAAEVQSYRIGRTIIESNRRYAYEEAQQVIDTKEGDDAEVILSLHSLAQLLRKRRFAQGAINFTSQEVQFVLDAEGRPVDVMARPHGTANELIEEFMLLANRTVATEFGKKQRNSNGDAKTFIYRIHDLPDGDKLNQMGAFIRRFGYQFKNATEASAISKNLNAVIEASLDKPEATLIQTMAVRTMARAEYSTENIGHYGLAFEYYTHFTSPIRRYPDLLVHRLVARYMAGEGSVPQAEYEAYAQHCSDQEQVAAKAERDSVRYKQVEYMSTRLGKVFDGVISNVAEWGFYVELTHSHCEGLVPMRLLNDDFYDYDEKNLALVGRRYRRKFTLGDTVRVRAIHSDFERRQIDFELVD